MKRWVLLIGIFLLLGGGILWAAQETSTMSPLREGDVIHLKVFNNRGIPEIDQDLTVDAVGDMNIPLVGFVKIGGLNLTQVTEHLNKVMAEKAFKGPRVQVSIVKLAATDRVFIFGSVKSPGPIEIRDKISVMDAVKQAGGFYDDIGNLAQGYYGGTNLYDNRANTAYYMPTQSLDYLSGTKVKRDGKEIIVDLKKLIKDGDTTQNIDLQNNDVLMIPSKSSFVPKLDETIYILGAVGQPGRYRFRDNMGVLDAIQIAGDLVSRHYIKFASIIRGVREVQKTDKDGKPLKGNVTPENKQPQIITVDIRSLLFRGEIQNDQKLQAGDILLVSTREYRSFLAQLGKFVDQFIPIMNRGDQTVGYDNSIRRFNDRFFFNRFP